VVIFKLSFSFSRKVAEFRLKFTYLFSISTCQLRQNLIKTLRLSRALVSAQRQTNSSSRHTDFGHFGLSKMTAWVIWQHNENTQTHWPIGDDGTGRQITPFASSVEWIGCVGGCVAVCGYRH